MPPPHNPAEGEVYWNTETKKTSIWTGSEWLEIEGTGPLFGLANDPYPQYPLIVSGVPPDLVPGDILGVSVASLIEQPVSGALVLTEEELQYMPGSGGPYSGHFIGTQPASIDPDDPSVVRIEGKDGRTISMGYDGTLKMSNGREANLFDLMDRMERMEQQMIKVYKYIPWTVRRGIDIPDSEDVE